MRLSTTLRRSVAVLLVTSALLVARADAAAVPDELRADSSLVAGTSAAVLDVNSDTNLLMTQLAAQYLLNQNFRILLELVNTSTLGGGPYSVSGVYITVLVSAHLTFIQCLATAIACSAAPDAQSGGTLITATVGNFAAGATQNLEVEVKPVQTGTGSVSATLHQNDFDPNPNNNTVGSTFVILEPPTGTIRGFKYEDMNGNGTWQIGEPALNGWEITLVGSSTETTTTRDIDLDNSGSIDADESGWFEFTDLEAGAYDIFETIPTGWFQSEPDFASYQIPLSAGEVREDLRFGNYRRAQLQGTVYDDADTTGFYFPPDTPLSGIPVTLVGTTGVGAPVSLNTQTDTGGLYSFADLDPGAYTVSAEDTLSVSRVLSHQLNLLSNMTAEGIDFGFLRPKTAPALSVTVAPETTPTTLGALETLTVTVTNSGDGAATNVRLRTHWFEGEVEEAFFGLPADCVVQRIPPFGDATCPLGDLAPGASRTLDFRFRIILASNVKPGVVATASADNHDDEFDLGFFDVSAPDVDLGIYRLGGPANKQAAAEVDVYLDSTLVHAALQAGVSTGFFEVPLTHTQPMLHVLPAGTTDFSTAELATQLQFGEAGEGDAFSLPSSYFLILTGGDTVTGAHTVRDAMSAAADGASVSFAMVHAAESLGEVEVSTAELGAVPLAPGAVTGYGSVSATTQVIEVLDPGTQQVLGTFAFDWAGAGGEAFVLVLSDGPALQAVGADGTVLTPSNPTAEEHRDLPAQVTLLSNYPNPFNPFTMIGYALPEATEVRLEVFDALGRRVATLVDGFRQAGRHESTFNATDLPSGLYVYRLTAGDVVQARTMVVLR